MLNNLMSTPLSVVTPFLLDKVEDSGSASGMLSVQQTQDQALPVGMAPRANPPSDGGNQ